MLEFSKEINLQKKTMMRRKMIERVGNVKLHCPSVVSCLWAGHGGLAGCGREGVGRGLGWRLQHGGGLWEGLSKTLVGEVRLERTGNIWKEKLEVAH